ncbi:hypothetical protein A2803_01610 [Candidatus Woesebacteria bacterium RIFCSPHIGHO2_01_FULL_44_21]|uniref:Uncharacterized protein n=1 Tax=Candidatus Woesebacteria bacterium RIFCSPHIGHO2_01_FULL_44_21 TaxID=1802503 RepID=A0A1F7YUW7_9BACT|nr:MAG: hypothetical protein A2803_01610 [Candidatus Woesebacteria bacterium RIFCSPHIGHO2_01_FULL_44_21]OGM69570.1 MAG: hypothetical protein A2897_03125 [Candidatus Woesebacteria bacterium RIFCSPLOWO2_01_FULL_44_24b]
MSEWLTEEGGQGVPSEQPELVISQFDKDKALEILKKGGEEAQRELRSWKYDDLSDDDHIEAMAELLRFELAEIRGEAIDDIRPYDLQSYKQTMWVNPVHQALWEATRNRLYPEDDRMSFRVRFAEWTNWFLREGHKIYSYPEFEERTKEFGLL